MYVYRVFCQRRLAGASVPLRLLDGVDVGATLLLRNITCSIHHPHLHTTLWRSVTKRKKYRNHIR